MAMDKSQVEKIINENIQVMASQLGLANWKITFYYRALDDAKMKIRLHEILSYKRAVITVDSECVETMEDVLNSLRHELLHIVAAPFTQAMYTVGKAIKDEFLTDVLNEVYRHHEEELIRNFEQVIDNMNQVFLEEKYARQP